MSRANIHFHISYIIETEKITAPIMCAVVKYEYYDPKTDNRKKFQVHLKCGYTKSDLKKFMKKIDRTDNIDSDMIHVRVLFDDKSWIQSMYGEYYINLCYLKFPEIPKICL